MPFTARSTAVLLAIACAAAAPHRAAFTQSPGIPPALAAMADAERAFARRAAETNWRDAFLEFFADEAVNFVDNTPGSARDRLRALPPPAPGGALVWEPRVGDIASSGDLGWLTGPAVITAPGGPERPGCYFSVWKKQADGSFKVILDEGANPPGTVPFAPGLVRSPATARPFTPRSGEVSADTLMAADRALGDAIAASGAAAAFRAVMHEGARMHRNGVLPMTSRTDVTTWLAASVTSMSSAPEKSEASAAGDLGYTWGKATVTGADGASKTGYYVRVWTRRDDGGWQLAADVAPM